MVFSYKALILMSDALLHLNTVLVMSDHVDV